MPLQQELHDMFDAQRGAGEILEVDDDMPDVEDTQDGGAIVRTGPAKEDNPDVIETQFYENLLIEGSGVDLPQSFIDKLAGNLLDSIDLDIQSREGRDKQYEEGLRRTGIGNDAPGGASFNGATKTAHPMITKAAVDFGARAIKELFPPNGPAKSFIPGEPTKERTEKAERKARHMNWQLIKQIPEFRPSLEKIFVQLPMGGVQYQRWVYIPNKKRASCSFVPLDQMIIPFAADDFYTAERRTFWEDITQAEFDKRVRDGVYIDEGLIAIASATVPEPTVSEQANQKIEGVSDPGDNRDGLRRVYETECELDLAEWDDQAGGTGRPYILRIDKDSRKCVGLTRNWEKGDKTFTEMTWTVEWPFIPWRGAMPIGIAQMIGGLSAAATGALRALLDSAHINNIPTLLRLKGNGQGGQSITLDPTQIQELEGTMGADDIRKLVMAIPFNEPSVVLFQLLGFLVSEAEGVVRTTFEDLAQQKTDMPVGTTLALIEQGMAVMSAIHGRLYAAMQKTLAVLARINRMYISDDDIRDETGELLARRADYQGPEDVIPVADPRIFSEVQRFAQMQVIADRAEKRPGLYNQRKVELLILERLKFPNPEQLLVAPPDPKELNAVNENVAATLGRPISAFPEQDHLAHIQAHVDYLQSPFFGMLAPIAQKFVPVIVQHLVEHITLWYASRVYEHASAAAGEDFSNLLKFKDPETRREVDRAVALASTLTIDEAQNVLKDIPQVIQGAMQVIQQISQAQQPQDPAAQAMVAVEQIKGQNQQQLEQAKQQGKQADTQAKAQTQAADKAAERQTKARERLQELQMRVVEGKRDSQESAQDRAADLQREQLKQTAESMRSEQETDAKMLMNTQDNQTALAIASAEIESGEKVAVSTGTGIGE